jgi:Na+-driven multidrug efflux pump
MAKKRFMVGLMAAILKFKMATDRGRFLSGTHPEMNQYPENYLCAKFGAFIPICMIFPLSAGLVKALHNALCIMYHMVITES